MSTMIRVNWRTDLDKDAHFEYHSEWMQAVSFELLEAWAAEMNIRYPSVFWWIEQQGFQ